MTADTTMQLRLVSHSPAQTQRIGERLAQCLQPGDVVCLQGDLGTGKTCLTQGIARGLGVKLAVTSPSFIMINEYALPGPARRLRHIDLYRVGSLSEARALGLEDYFYADGICVVEWAERALELLPPQRLWIVLRHLGETERELTLDAQGECHRDLVPSLQQNEEGSK